MEDDALKKGFAFDPSDIWRHSALKPTLDEGTLFHPLATRFGELDTGIEALEPMFIIPELGNPENLVPIELENVDSDLASLVTAPTSPIRQGQNVELDIWTVDLDAAEADRLPHLFTWDAFERKHVPNVERTAYLSEAGPSAFDAALVLSKEDEAYNGVLPEDVTLRALCNLALGRSSIFYQWDPKEKRFAPTLKDVPISGYSTNSSDSFNQRLIEFGSITRKLTETASHAIKAKHSFPAFVALHGCLSDILDSVERHVTLGISRVRSLLQLQRLIDRPHQLLNIVNQLMESGRMCTSDEEAISTLSDLVHLHLSLGNDFAESLQAILARVSAPWLERLSLDLGLNKSSKYHSLTHPNSDGDENVGDLHTSFDQRGPKEDIAPSFIGGDDWDLIEQTKKSLRILRQHAPETRLDTTTTGVASRATKTGTESITPGVAFHNVVPTLVSEAQASYLTGTERIEPNQDTWMATTWQGYIPWAEKDDQLDYLMELNANMSLLPGSNIDDSNALRLIVDAKLENAQATASSGDSKQSHGQTFDPLDEFRPQLRAHSTLVYTTLLSYLFKDCQLMHHFDLQWQYHLLGNGEFVTRLSTALFSSDTQSAERKRGIVPTGEEMGLRLDARDGQRWPPASSELRLTLAGVLTESYNNGSQRATSARDIKELPGNLSFSIRELPDEEIEKVMDTGSIYALDFLRLQYTAPSPLDAILNASAMHAYDGIFRFLLRMLRVLYFISAIRQQLAANETALKTVNSRFIVEAHHFMSVAMSHFMDVGIAAPWRNFMSSLSRIESSMNQSNQTANITGLDSLRHSHESCVEQIRSRLFLRRKQEKIRNAFESTFGSILNCATLLGQDQSSDIETGAAVFTGFVTEVLRLLEKSAGKAARGTAVDKIVEDEHEAARILLIRLNWNSYYQETTDG